MVSRAATPRTPPPTPTRLATTVLHTAPPAGRERWGRRHHTGRPIGRYTGPATAATPVAGADRVRSAVGPAVATACARSAAAVVAAAGAGRVRSAAGPAVQAACAGSAAAAYAGSATVAVAAVGGWTGMARRGFGGVGDYVAGGSRCGFGTCLAGLRRGEVARGTVELPRIPAAQARPRERSLDGVAIACAATPPGRAAGRLAGAVFALPRGEPDAVSSTAAAVLPRVYGERVVSGGTGAHALGMAPSRATDAADRSRTPSRWPPLPRTGRE